MFAAGYVSLQARQQGPVSKYHARPDLLRVSSRCAATHSENGAALIDSGRDDER